MTFTSNLAESMVLEAVNFSMNKACKANIIIAGPICSGKYPIAEYVRKFYAGVKSYRITLMNQTSFYKPLSEMEETQYGYNVDAVEAFYEEEFRRKVKALFEVGISSSPYYNMKTWSRGMPEIERQCSTEEQKQGVRSRSEIFTFHNNGIVNIFIGEHAITLLEDIVPDAIKVYLNTDFGVCIKRRFRLECFRRVANFKTVSEQNDYVFNFVSGELHHSVYPQKEKADIVLKANDDE